MSKKSQRDDLVLRILRTIQTDVMGLKRDVAVLKKDVAGLKKDMAEVKRDIAELKTGLRRLDTRVDHLESAVVLGFKLVIRRIDDHRAFAIDRLREHDQRLDSLEIQRAL